VSDEERKMHAKENDEDTGAEDVEAHVRGGRHADESGDEGDDVEAHVRGGRHADESGDDGDDVEAHVKGVR
jgi:hypothetical protein